MMNEEKEPALEVSQPTQTHASHPDTPPHTAPVPVTATKDPVAPADKEPVPLNSMGLPRYKSYRKKYKKMLIRFNSCMARSTDIFRDDLRARKIYSRIVRENMTLLGLMERIKQPPADSDDDKEVVCTDEAKNLSVKLMEKATSEVYQSVRSEEVTELNPNSIGMWLKRNHAVLNTEEEFDEGKRRRKGGSEDHGRKRIKRGSMSQGSS